MAAALPDQNSRMDIFTEAFIALSAGNNVPARYLLSTSVKISFFSRLICFMPIASFRLNYYDNYIMLTYPIEY